MLKLFRRRMFLVRLMLFAVVGVVGFMMVITLVPGLGSGDVSLRDPQGVIARVGEHSVTQTEVQERYERTAEQFGGQNPLFRQLILKNLIEQLITQRVVEYEAEQLGLEVAPEELAAQLRQISLFYPGGKFVGADTYRLLVQQQFRMTVPQFEELLRQEVLQAKVFTWVTGGLTITPAEVELEYRRQNERAQIDYVLLRTDEFARQVQPPDAELRPYYERNRERYRVPERRAVRFVAIDYATLVQRIQVSPRELEAYYQSRRETYRVPERVRVRHILFLNVTGGGAATNRKKAEQVLAELRRGKNFSALAKQDSEDATTREKGGDIGWVLKGQTVPELEQELFSLRPGGPPALVETSYGFHIVQVLEHQSERVRSLEEVRGEIEPVIKQEKVRQAAQEGARQIVDAVRAGKTLEEATKQAGWPVLTSPLFSSSQTLPQLGQSREFQEVTFRLPAETAGKPGAPVSDPISLQPGYVILQLKEVSPAHTASFEEVRENVLQAYRQERGTELAREAARRLAAEAEKSRGVRGPAQKMGLTLKASTMFGREGAIPELGPAREVAPVAFSLPVGGISPALPVGQNWVVFQLSGREEADLSRLTPPERKALSQDLLGGKRGLTWAIFHQSLRKKLQAEGKLKINQAAIERLTGKS